MSSNTTVCDKRPKPSEAFARRFGVEHGVDLPPPVRVSYRPLDLSGEDSETPSRSQG